VWLWSGFSFKPILKGEIYRSTHHALTPMHRLNRVEISLKSELMTVEILKSVHQREHSPHGIT
jgi:hypothetical protein